MFDGKLGKARDDKSVCYVEMNDVQFLAFKASRRVKSIGTAQLGGCSVVMIVSKDAAIMGHIAPVATAPRTEDNPYPMPKSLEEDASGRHCNNKMDQVEAYYKANKKYFPKGNSWAVCAAVGANLGVEDHWPVIKERLRQLGLPPSLETYQVNISGDAPKFKGCGTVYIDGSGTSGPAVYVEDRLIHGISPRLAQSVPSTSTSQQLPEPYYQSQGEPSMSSGYPQPQPIQPYYQPQGSSSMYSGYPQPQPLQPYYQPQGSSSTYSGYYSPQPVSYASSSGQAESYYPQSQGSMSSGRPTQSSQGHSTTPQWIPIPDNDILWAANEHGEPRIYFVFQDHSHETKMEEWKPKNSPFNNRQVWVYTRSRDGTKFYRENMRNIQRVE